MYHKFVLESTTLFMTYSFFFFFLIKEKNNNNTTLFMTYSFFFFFFLIKETNNNNTTPFMKPIDIIKKCTKQAILFTFTRKTAILQSPKERRTTIYIYKA